MFPRTRSESIICRAIVILSEIQVEKTYFRLHRHFFERESDYFRAWLKPPTEGEGPYVIDDVKSDEFAQFVWIWYNP